MPHQATAPAEAEADALRPLAQAITHAQIPAALKLLLLALLKALSGRGTARRVQGDWYYPSHQQDTSEDSDSYWHPRALRAVRRHRAWIGWILRCLPGLGMALSGDRALPRSPTRTARAPPRPG